MGKILDFKHGRSSVENVDARLWDIVQHAIAVMPYDAEIRSGSERGDYDKGNHSTGNAVDVTFFDEDGNPIKDIGPHAESAKIYEQYAQAARVYQQAKYPELDTALRWGGGFRQGNEFDFMHLDITHKQAGSSKMAYYDWEEGFNPTARARLPRLNTIGVSPGLGDPAVRGQLELVHQNAGTLLPSVGNEILPMNRLDAQWLSDNVEFGVPPDGSDPGVPTGEIGPVANGSLIDSNEQWADANGGSSYQDALRTLLTPKVPARPSGPLGRRQPQSGPPRIARGNLSPISLALDPSWDLSIDQPRRTIDNGLMSGNPERQRVGPWLPSGGSNVPGAPAIPGLIRRTVKTIAIDPLTDKPIVDRDLRRASPQPVTPRTPPPQLRTGPSRGALGSKFATRPGDRLSAMTQGSGLGAGQLMAMYTQFTDPDAASAAEALALGMPMPNQRSQYAPPPVVRMVRAIRPPQRPRETFDQVWAEAKGYY
jgi:hypothetical protein